MEVNSTKALQNKFSKTARMKMGLENPHLVIREKCNRSLHFFVRYFWDTVINDPFQDNFHLHVFCDELEAIAHQVGNRIPNEYDLIVNVPPGTTKTSVFAVFFPAWVWTKYFWVRFITASYSSSLSLESAESSRDVIKSNKFKYIYPDITIKRDKDVKSNFRIVKMASGRPVLGGNRYSTSVGGTLMGYHGHINLVDDAIDPKRAASEKELNTCNKWVGDTLSTRKADKKVTANIMIQQRIDQKDPSGTRMAKGGGYRHICLPGEIRTKGFKELVRPEEMIESYTDGILDPTRMPWNVLEKMKMDLGQYGYRSQVGQDPQAFTGGMFNVDMLRTIGLAEADDVLAPSKILGVVRYWDKAATEVSGKGKATAGVKMYRVMTVFGIRYIISDVKRGFWKTHIREQVIRTTAEADGVNVKVYHEQEPGSGGKDSAIHTTNNLAGFSVTADRPTTNKIARADPFSVQVNLGNVWMVSGHWNEAYRKEMQDFGPNSEFMDQIDASAGAFSKLALGKEAGVW